MKAKWVIAIIIAVVVALVGTYVSVGFVIYKFDSHYYKEQMHNFCELSLVERDLILELEPALNGTIPEIKECDYWNFERPLMGVFP